MARDCPMAPIIWLVMQLNAPSRLVIAKETQRYEFPEKKRMDASYTHNFKDLVRVARLQGSLEAAAKSDPLFRKYWNDVQSWSEQNRYGRHSQESARLLIEAIGDRTMES